MTHYHNKTTARGAIKRSFFPAVLAAILLSFALVSGCKKNNSTPTIEQQLTGKWTLSTAIGEYTIQGTTTKDTTHFSASDYFDFKADGTIAIHEGNENFNGKWKVTNNKLFITETPYMAYAAGYDLPILTTSELQIYHNIVNSFSNNKFKLNLKK